MDSSAVVSVAGLAIYNATRYSGLKSGARLQNLSCYLKRGGEACTMTQKGVNYTEYNLRYEQVGDYKVLTEGREDYLKSHPDMWTKEEQGDDYVKRPN